MTSETVWVCGLGWVVTVPSGTVWGMQLRMGRYCDSWDSVRYTA